MTTIRHPTALHSRWAPLLTGLVWCAAALSAGYWVWHFPSGSFLQKTTLTVSAQSALAAPTNGLPRILGATHVEVARPSADDKSIQLLGVIAGSSGQGSALMTIDGQVPKSFRVGQTVSDGLVLQRLDARRAQLGASLNGPTLRELQLPPLQKP